eukprot:1758310-Alexandrium_andersonii.AAC.1
MHLQGNQRWRPAQSWSERWPRPGLPGCWEQPRRGPHAERGPLASGRPPPLANRAIAPEGQATQLDPCPQHQRSIQGHGGPHQGAEGDHPQR